MSAARRALILVGLIPTLIITFVPLGKLGRTYSGLGDLWGNEALFWALTAILLLYVVFIERRPFSSIGFRMPGAVDLLLGVLAGIFMVVGITTIFFVLFPLLHLKMNAGEMSKLLHTPFWYRFFLVTRAAVSEEILFRGYPIERIEELTGRRWLAALLSVAAFTYAHLAGWGAAQLIVAAFGGVVLTALYLWRRNLWVNMLAHWIADGAGFLLSH
jgi:membrane protease YdiL (CAAX protease family)